MASKNILTDLIGTRVTLQAGTYNYSTAMPGEIRVVGYDAKEQDFQYGILLDDGRLVTASSRWFTVGVEPV